MDRRTVDRSKKDSNYRALVSESISLGWTLAIVTLALYFGFIALVAFWPDTIGIKFAGTITVGIFLGAFLIVAAIFLTRHLRHAHQRALRRLHQGRRADHGDGRPEVRAAVRGAALAGLASAARAAGPLEVGTMQATNWYAIGIFVAFVAQTLGIPHWAAMRTRTAKDFHSDGGGVTGFQNGLAIAGDFMSAASFLGITSLVYIGGYYGLIYSIGFVVGWPIIMFLIAEPLRNLGKFTFADSRLLSPVANADPGDGRDRRPAMVAFYLIARMVDAGELIALLFGLPYLYAVIVVGVLMITYVNLRRHDRHHLGPDHQGGPAARRLDPDLAPGAGEVRLRFQRADRQGGRSSSKARRYIVAGSDRRQPDQCLRQLGKRELPGPLAVDLVDALTTRGAVIDGWTGLLSALVRRILSPSIWEAVLGFPKGSALFPQVSPALFTMPLSFLCCWAFSVTDTPRRAAIDKAGFDAQYVVSQTGIGAEGAVAH